MGGTPTLLHLCLSFFLYLLLYRSKKEQERLHKLSKPRKEAPSREDGLPSIDSHSEDEGSWTSGIEKDDDISDVSDDISIAESSSSVDARNKQKRPRPCSDDEEMPYEMLPRRQQRAVDEDKGKGIARLPIKLQDGKIHKSAERIIPRGHEESETDSEPEDIGEEEKAPAVEDISTGARFGRRAVVDVISTKSRKAKIQAAKEQIASLCQEVVAEPENSVSVALLEVMIVNSDVS